MRIMMMIFLTAFSVMSHASQTLVVGNHIGSIQLQDQFDEQYGTQKETTTLLFSRSMQGGILIQAVLSADPSLHKNPNLLYIADISAMPSLVFRFMVKSEFQKLPFKVALDKQGMATKQLPAKEDHATLMKLNNGEIVSINYFESEVELFEALTEALLEVKTSTN